MWHLPNPQDIINQIMNGVHSAAQHVQDDVVNRIASGAQDLEHKAEAGFQDLEHKAEALALKTRQEIEKDAAAVKQSAVAEMAQVKQEINDLAAQAKKLPGEIEQDVEKLLEEKLAKFAQLGLRKTIDTYHDVRRKNGTGGSHNLQLSFFTFEVKNIADHIDKLTAAANKGIQGHDDVRKLIYAIAPDEVGLDFSVMAGFLVESEDLGFNDQVTFPLAEFEIQAWAFLRNFAGIEIPEPDALPAD